MMAAIDWQKVHGCEFTGDEAREASDFVEVLRNFGLDAEGGWGLFEDHKNLSVGKRLVFAEKIPIDKATIYHYMFEDILAHFIWEITYHGITNKEVIKKREKMFSIIKEAKIGKKPNKTKEK